MTTYLVPIGIQAGEYHKSVQLIVKAPSATLARSFAIYLESHDPENLNWASTEEATESFDEFTYYANRALTVLTDEDLGLLTDKLGMPFWIYDTQTLRESGNYAELSK